jgi:dimethylamine monooxygenase subunit B
MDAVLAGARARGWPEQRLHHEAFLAPEPAGEPFTVRLHRRDQEIHVPADGSMLDALLRAGLPHPYLCRSGVCGECRVTLLRGEADHRDLYLSDAERAAGGTVMPCVSRGITTLEVDL